MFRTSGEVAHIAGEWECMECGYIEEGIKGRRPRRCPECDAPASALEFFPDEDDADLYGTADEEYEEDELEEFGEEETAPHDREYDEEEG
jgi:hypothetical protein